MLSTDRLILRRWKASDREPFAAMCADPHVMRFFPKTVTVEQTDTAVNRSRRTSTHMDLAGLPLNTGPTESLSASSGWFTSRLRLTSLRLSRLAGDSGLSIGIRDWRQREHGRRSSSHFSG